MLKIKVEDKMPDAPFFKIRGRIDSIVLALKQINDFNYGQVNNIRVELIKIENTLNTISPNFSSVFYDKMFLTTKTL